MKLHLRITFAVCGCLLFFLGTSLSMAESTKKFTKKPTVSVEEISSKPQKMQVYDANNADLTVGELEWIDHCPVPGDRVGDKGILKVEIINNGKKISENTYIKFSCQSLSGQPCPNGVNNSLPCAAVWGAPKLLSWPSLASGIDRWKAGKYRLTIEVDSANKVSESNESNNIVYKDFTVYSKVVNPPGSTQDQSVQAQPAVVPALRPDIVIQNIEIIPLNPGVNEYAKFLITYRNIGNGKSSDMRTMFDFYRINSNGTREDIGGNNLFEPEALAPGEIRETSNVLWPIVIHNSKAKSGDTIEAVFKTYGYSLDPKYKSESNVQNNTNSITFKVK